jgi:predicted PurR-regulated permease PerM
MLEALFFCGLAAASFWVLRPFLPALIWAATIVIATWPLMLKLQRVLWGRRSLAVALCVFLFLLLFVIPFSIALLTIVNNAATITDWGRELRSFHLPPPPDWLEQLPGLGAPLTERWAKLRAADSSALLAPLTPYVGLTLRWFVSQVGGFGLLLLHFLLTLLLAVILFLKGESAERMALRFSKRLGGKRGEDAARLAGRAVRAVALGVMLTALVQSCIAAVGLLIAGVPRVFLLTALMLIMSVVQIGAVPVMLAVVAWLFWSGQTGWAVFMIVWTVLVGSIDNFLRPVLIRRGANLPLLLIFAGVIGGLFAFGVIGLFVGPVVLAVAYTLLTAWIDNPAR